MEAERLGGKGEGGGVGKDVKGKGEDSSSDEEVCM